MAATDLEPPAPPGGHRDAGSAVPAVERRSGNVVDQVAKAIRQQILDGELPPGIRLSQADVAEAMQVSRTPLREALHKLEAEGLVVSLANRGMRVAPASLSQVEDAYALRLLAEPPVVRAMVLQTKDTDLDTMSHRLLAMEAPNLSTREFQDAHFAFHRVLTDRYPRAVHEMVNTQLLAIYRHQRLYFDRPRALSDFTEADRAFLGAVSAHNGDAAHRIMEFHLLDAAIGLVHGVEPDYAWGELRTVTDGLGIVLTKRADGRFDIRWSTPVGDIALAETSNLVPQDGIA